jgi:hypothetical protein
MGTLSNEGGSTLPPLKREELQAHPPFLKYFLLLLVEALVLILAFFLLFLFFKVLLFDGIIYNNGRFYSIST